MRRPPLRGTLGPMLLTVVALFASPSFAQATYDPLGSGTVKLTLDQGFSRFLAQNQVQLSAGAPARRQGRTLALPALGGKIDPPSKKAEVKAMGSLIFESTRRRLPLRNLTVKANHSPLIAKVGGGQLKLATSPALDSRRSGFGVELTAKKLALSAKLATRLNKKLRPAEPFQAGQQLGTLTTQAQPLTATLLPSGSVALAFAPAFLAKLDSLHVSINPVFPAEHPGPSFSFPIIVGGAISPDASTGTLRTGGDLEFLQLGAGQVFWHEQWLDLGAHSDSAEVSIQPSPPYAGKIGRTPIAPLTLAGPAVANTAKRTIAVEGASLTLDPFIAATFNDAFAKPQGKAGVFVAGEAVGTMSFTAQGQ